MNRSHQPLAVGFHTGANTESVSVRSSSGPSMSGSGVIAGEMVRTRSAIGAPLAHDLISGFLFFTRARWTVRGRVPSSCRTS